jgi:hypothetical protein
MNLTSAIRRPAGILPWLAGVVLTPLTAAAPAALANPQAQPPAERPHPASRPGRDGFTGRFTQDITAATSVATGQNRPAPSTTAPRRRMMIAPRLRPRTSQLCTHCRQNPAGFWVSRTSDQTVRRPWCLSCCQWLDPARYHVIPFDRHSDTGRFR